MAGIRFDGFAMKVILWILNLADFVSHGLMTSQNGYRHTYRLLTVVTFRTQRVPSSPSSTVFSITVEPQLSGQRGTKGCP